MCPPMCLHCLTSTYFPSIKGGTIEAWAKPSSPDFLGPPPQNPTAPACAEEYAQGALDAPGRPDPESKAGSGTLPAWFNATTVLLGAGEGLAVPVAQGQPRRMARSLCACLHQGDPVNS